VSVSEQNTVPQQSAAAERDGTAPGPDSATSAAGAGRDERALGWVRWLHGRLPSYAPPVYRRHSYLQVLAFAALMVLVGRLWSGNDYRLGVMATAFTYAIATVGLYFAYTLGGLFAFSQAAFMGLGAYVSAKVGDEYGFLYGFFAAMVVSFVVAVAVGIILRKARHLYFAIGALAVAELMGLAFANWTFLGGDESGAISGIVPPNAGYGDLFTASQLFWFTLVVTCLVLLASMLVERSPMRRNALAAKQIPMVARASGVPVYRVTIMLFGYGCVLAATAGSLEAHSIGSITPDTFNVGLAIDLHLMLLLGGLRSIWGAVVGAIFFVWLPEWLRSLQEYHTVIYSFLLLLTIIVMPEGIVGTLSKLAGRVVRRAQGN
jgi:branched-chain amino acid transport system permease protein